MFGTLRGLEPESPSSHQLLLTTEPFGPSERKRRCEVRPASRPAASWRALPIQRRGRCQQCGWGQKVTGQNAERAQQHVSMTSSFMVWSMAGLRGSPKMLVPSAGFVDRYSDQVKVKG
eukprot:TRINITY_DN20619_c0_g1_i1.p1 TRINITY_DN20619_c0_g1~~TRINITY_DN20619_c0_g1_i1.p1  ORF type:complete len:118 (+),score=2.45 TRINITY_DN20619_c0_g1_i1:198-551(+)